MLADASRRATIHTMSRRITVTTPDLLMRAYRAGLFPMAETRRGARIYWLDPELRGVLPLDGFHMPKRLLRTVLSGRYQVTSNQSFAAVVAGCAAAAPGREDTWINADIERLFGDLHRRGCAHSVECRLDGVLVGGLYGVSLGGAFFGESMFSVARDASKVALVHLVARMRLGGYTLLDTQFVTKHLAQFGANEIPRELYKTLLATAVQVPAQWLADPDPAALEADIRLLHGQSAPAASDLIGAGA